MTTDNQQLLTVNEISAILKIHINTVRRYIREKELPAAKVGRAYLVRRQDLDRFIERRLTIKDF